MCWEFDRKPVIEDDGLDIRIGDDADHRVLERTDDRLVHERVLRAPQPPDLLAHFGPRRGGARHDEQHFEIRLVGCHAFGGRK